MNTKQFLLGTALLAAASLGANNLYPPAAKDFAARVKDYPSADFRKALADSALTPEEYDAMEFLYAYLPTPDIADRSPQFYLANVRSSLQARREMPWGASVPDREWRHFVLPVRVNNEAPDLSRPYFFNELKERVKGMTMAEAALEVNHWLHEKVTYQPSDGRTSAPYATMRNALGRCGEESTFGVAVLRALGIPARQVYTPRWAHTDDNHAWVEVFTGDGWHFLGACEPEPVLDLAWFNKPASRGMLMNTSVFGNYDGPEEKIEERGLLTEINVTSNYAPVTTTTVTAQYSDGTPAKDATVRFCLYNYAEFYPLAVRKADAAGHASLTTGLGDMVVWASDGKNFGFAPVTAGTPAVVTLDKDASFAGVIEFDVTPPVSNVELPKVTAEQNELNECRKAEEDSIRTAYTNTFLTELQAKKLAQMYGTDMAKTADILVNARGNHQEISQLINNTPQNKRTQLIEMLEALTVKDMHDLVAPVIEDHLLTPWNPRDTSSLYQRYVLNPRVNLEELTPWRAYFDKKFSKKDKKKYRENPQLWAKWLAKNIKTDAPYNPSKLRMSPKSVMEGKRGNDRSRSICFVAGCRSLGIPARIDPVTGKTQFANAEGQWIDADFSLKKEKKNKKATAPELYPVPLKGVDGTPEPKYFFHYTLGRISDGLPTTLDYDDALTPSEIQKIGEGLEAGQYMLTTGRRLADGSVMVRTEFFPLDASTQMHDVVVRHDDTRLEVIGNVNAEDLFTDTSDSQRKSILDVAGRGYYVLGLVRPNHEPTAHTLNELCALKKEFEATGRKLILLLPDALSAERFDRSRFPDLPDGVVIGVDNDGAIAAEIAESLHLDDEERPLFIIADSFNRIVYARRGYTIAQGDKIVEILSGLKE